MAQSALTVTLPNPTPPTNFSFTGARPPNPPNYTKNTYNDPKNWSAANPKDFPPPYFDDGTSSAALAFAANTAALASGSGSTAGGTENTYPGIGGLTPPAPNMGGAVPASTSVAAEGAGSEVVVTQTYSSTVLVPGSAASYIPTGQTPAWAAGDPGGPLRTFSCLGTFTGVANAPNAQHASSLSPATNPALASINPTSTVSGAGTQLLTCTGTNFTRQSVIYVNGVAQATTFVSATSLTATVTKKATAGTWPVTVITGGAITTAAQTWTFT